MGSIRRDIRTPISIGAASRRRSPHSSACSPIRIMVTRLLFVIFVSLCSNSRDCERTSHEMKMSGGGQVGMANVARVILIQTTIQQFPIQDGLNRLKSVVYIE